MAKIVSCIEIGEFETNDLEVDHEDHQFYLANGILTSNSHAVSYAMCAFQCAYLMTYFEPEWLCVYLDSMSGDDESKARAASEVRSLGYSIGKVDINRSGLGWVLSGDGMTFHPSFTSVKGIGESAVREILEKRPYNSMKELLWDSGGEWKHSRFNRRAFEALIQIGAFDSMDLVGPDRTFSSYRHMHHVVIEHGDALKRATRRMKLRADESKEPFESCEPAVALPDPFKEPLDRFEDFVKRTRSIDDWTSDEKVAFQTELLGSSSADAFLPQDTLSELKRQGIASIDALVSGPPALSWFIVRKSDVARTKQGKPYVRLEVIGEAGATKRVFAWGLDPEVPVAPNVPYLAIVEKNDFGISLKGNNLRRI